MALLDGGGFVVADALPQPGELPRYFTRFTDEIFGALIALIFITEAIRDIFGDIVSEEVSTSGEPGWTTCLAHTGRFTN